MAKEACVTHSHMECGSYHLMRTPRPGSEPQPLLLLEPTIGSPGFLMGQGQEVKGPLCAADAPGLSDLRGQEVQ